LAENLSEDCALTPEQEEEIETGRKLVTEYVSEIKKITKDSELDVMALENRTYLLQKGYLKVGQKELNPEYTIN
jgi:hypothetical protein